MQQVLKVFKMYQMKTGSPLSLFSSFSLHRMPQPQQLSFQLIHHQKKPGLCISKLVTTKVHQYTRRKIIFLHFEKNCEVFLWPFLLFTCSTHTVEEQPCHKANLFLHPPHLGCSSCGLPHNVELLNYRIIQFGRRALRSSPTINLVLPSLLLNCVPKYHIYMFLNPSKDCDSTSSLKQLHL